MTIDQVKVIEIGADAIEEVLLSSAGVGLAYPPKLMHAVVAALGRHGYIIEDRYEDAEESPVDPGENEHLVPHSVIVRPDLTMQPIPGWVPDPNDIPRTAPDWDTSGDDM